MRGRRVLNRLRRLVRGRELHVFYHRDFRLPLAGIAAQVGIEPRRADLVAWYLLEERIISKARFHEPELLPYSALARVHTDSYLESLNDPQTIARILGVDRDHIPVNEVLRTMRLGCGATVEAAQFAVRNPRKAAFNLLGGFHHAEPDRGGGMCIFNDIAVAIATLREQGFRGTIVTLDLDAHPSDGISACLRNAADVWNASISATDWGELPGVWEITLPAGTGDVKYLSTLEDVLDKMPKAALAFVIAGGDVLADDRLGGFSLTLAGARKRDLLVARALARVPSVWLPGGGYHKDAWRVLAGSALAVELGSFRPIARRAQPLAARYAYLSRHMDSDALTGEEWFTEADLADALGGMTQDLGRLLGFYTLEGIEAALSHFGILPQLRRLGYSDFRLIIHQDDPGERLQVHGRAAGDEHLLIEIVVERKKLDEEPVLYVHWLTMRNPLAASAPGRPLLPGQEAPGLGLAQEAGALLIRMAKRLGMAGVAFRTGHFHVAYAARKLARFVDPEVQGRFLALVQALETVPLADATAAVAENRLLLNGEPYEWEPLPIVTWLRPRPDDREEIATTAAMSFFEIVPRTT
jgi:acetoin utilization deacetylase AcuC-like enzyme